MHSFVNELELPCAFFLDDQIIPDIKSPRVILLLVLMFFQNKGKHYLLFFNLNQNIPNQDSQNYKYLRGYLCGYIYVCVCVCVCVWMCVRVMCLFMCRQADINRCGGFLAFLFFSSMLYI